MKTKVLAIGVVRKGDSILLRKKPDGSPPYAQTWYLFGGELNGTASDPEKVLKSVLKAQAGIDVKPVKRLGWDTETKPDERGERAFYIYLDYLVEYIKGELAPGKGIEKLEWAPISELGNYDLVPPSVTLFKSIGYL